MEASAQKTVDQPVQWSDNEAGLFAGGGELGALMQQKDWAATPLGPVTAWPQNLKTTIRIVLTSRQPMFVWWGEHLINLYNDAYRSILGGKHPWALGLPASVVWREIWDQIKSRAESALHSNQGTYDEALMLIMERYGYPEETYYTFSYSPVPDEQGRVGGILCANTDDTQRIIGERQIGLLGELAARMAEARTWQDACRLAVQGLSSNAKDICFALIYVLEQGKAVLAASTSEVRPGSPFAPEEISPRDTTVWPVGEVMNSQEFCLLEDLHTRAWDLPCGAWDRAPERAALVPILPAGPAGRAGVLVVGLNPFRRVDESYRGFLKLLAGQISAGIANAEAYEKERQRAEALAELDRAKTDFFSNVSHEFRTPLTLMLGPIEEMLHEAQQRLTPQDVERLTIARRNALRLLKLVNALLDFSKIEANRMQAVFEPVDLCALTQDIASVFRSAMEKAGLRFRVSCEEIVGATYVDREMWEKVVLNLISNAFKFTHSGEVEVALRDAGERVELTVRDTGVGIPQDELPKIFERFHRIIGAEGRSYEGTGIGLALVRELVKLHGGAIHVQSAPGQGSTFTVSLPKGKEHLSGQHLGRGNAKAAAKALSQGFVEEAVRWLDGPSEESFSPAESKQIQGTGDDKEVPEDGQELVLLADDNADMREYITRLLQDKYHVYTVADGEQAVEAAARLRPALVLTDIMMPKLDGLGVLKAIRSDPSLEGTPVILLSARAGEDARVEGLDAGADDYLVKPFTARELLARVGTHLRMVRLRRESREREMRVQADMAQMRNTLAAIVEWSEDPILSKDLNGTITSWNAAAERIFGYSEEEVLGQSVFKLIPPELHGQELQLMSMVRQGQRIQTFESVRLAKSGERVDVSLTISPVRNAAGQIIGAATILRDITQKKKAEQALRISERLASMGRLAATIAHEINNPLEAATNLVYLARHTAEDQQVEHYLAGAEEELARVSEMARQTLGFSRAPTAAIPMRVGALLESVIHIFTPRARNKRIQLVADVRQDPEMVAVSGEVRQLLINLIGNSIDAMRGPGTVQVRIREARHPRGVRITVADSGSGIPAEIRTRIFEPFFTTKEEVGTGLGLWICKDIVTKHGGRLRVRSSTEPGRSWTIFSAFFPMLRED